jgi:GNAT superfamily N-acetyltransferase
MEHARPATATDLPAVAHLLAAQHAELAPQRGGDLWTATHPVAPMDELAAMLDDPAALVLCGTWCDVVAGALTARLVVVPGIGPIASVDDLYVDAGFREVGVGAALMDALRVWARTAGCVGIDAAVLPGARATKNFFEAHGLVARAITVHHRFDAEASA